MDRIIARLGDACAAPFAVLGLPPVRQREIARFLGYFGFTIHALDAVVVDLTRTAIASL